MDMEGIEGADVITAGFPCQDISYAGKGAGLSGERSGSGWWQTRRAIRMVRPRVALLENVAALLNRGMGTVLGGLAQIGYDAEWHCIPAAHVGAPHIRDRAWIVAHTTGERCRPHVPDTDGQRVQGQRSCGVEKPLAHAIEKLLVCCREGAGKAQWETEPGICRVVDGLPDRVDRVKALGNSVVPQIPEIIGYAIAEKLLGKDIV